MSHYEGSVPETLRAPDWREAASCATTQYAGHRDLWFAQPADTEGIAAAKRVCATCPVTRSCLAYALDEHLSDGIFGGLTQPERASLQRRKARGQHARPLPARSKEHRPASLREAFERRARTAADGHIVWDGSVQFKWKTTKYNPLRVAFALHHGREPEGTVRRACAHNRCFAGDHLSDAVIRASAGEYATTKALAS